MVERGSSIGEVLASKRRAGSELQYPTISCRLGIVTDGLGIKLVTIFGRVEAMNLILFLKALYQNLVVHRLLRY